MTAEIQPAPVRSRPIAFSAPMVRAILAGAKSQTRRVVKPQPVTGCRYEMNAASTHALHLSGEGASMVFVPATARSADHKLPCPYGAPGDLLWVKEPLYRDPQGLVRYVADDAMPEGREIEWDWKPKSLGAMYCPRWASRLTPEVTEIRVQRLADISEEDARAEGAPENESHFDCPMTADGPPMRLNGARSAFARLWDSINAKRPGCAWAANPWIWAVSFAEVRP